MRFNDVMEDVLGSQWQTRDGHYLRRGSAIKEREILLGYLREAMDNARDGRDCAEEFLLAFRKGASRRAGAGDRNWCSRSVAPRARVRLFRRSNAVRLFQHCCRGRA